MASEAVSLPSGDMKSTLSGRVITCLNWWERLPPVNTSATAVTFHRMLRPATCEKAGGSSHTVAKIIHPTFFVIVIFSFVAPAWGVQHFRFYF
jgi:hypothetical protein